MDDFSECHYPTIIVIMMMTSIENIYLATQLNRDGDAHVCGLNVLACVGWFEMDGFCGCMCSGSVVCSSERHGYKLWSITHNIT